jgi:hypothetical protein
MDERSTVNRLADEQSSVWKTAWLWSRPPRGNQHPNLLPLGVNLPNQFKAVHAPARHLHVSVNSLNARDSLQHA